MKKLFVILTLCLGLVGCQNTNEDTNGICDYCYGDPLMIVNDNAYYLEDLDLYQCTVCYEYYCGHCNRNDKECICPDKQNNEEEKPQDDFYDNGINEQCEGCPSQVLCRNCYEPFDGKLEKCPNCKLENNNILTQSDIDSQNKQTPNPANDLKAVFNWNKTYNNFDYPETKVTYRFYNNSDYIVGYAKIEFDVYDGVNYVTTKYAEVKNIKPHSSIAGQFTLSHDHYDIYDIVIAEYLFTE